MSINPPTVRNKGSLLARNLSSFNKNLENMHNRKEEQTTKFGVDYNYHW